MVKVCVMLAAGLSSRMGQWTMMMPWGEGTILDSAIENALAFCDQVILVTGFRGDELVACYQDHPAVRVVYNPAYQTGMLSSIQCGIRLIREPRFFLALGDMPEVTSDVYRTLWAYTGENTCFIPVYEQGKGHPVLLPRCAIELINNAPAGVTLRKVIKQMDMRKVPVSTQGVHWDVDTPVQYQQIARLSHKDRVVQE